MVKHYEITGVFTSIAQFSKNSCSKLSVDHDSDELNHDNEINTRYKTGAQTFLSDIQTTKRLTLF